MPYTNRTEPVRRALCALAGSSRWLLLVAAVFVLAQLSAPGAPSAHEGHDHDKPAPLNLPIAPRVVAVTPDYELVGVLSGEQRLTIFLHHFATGAPVMKAKLAVSAGDLEAEAVAKEEGIFEVEAPWLRSKEPLDLVFRLALPDDQDVLTGRLARTGIANVMEAPEHSSVLSRYQTLAVGIGALMAGVLVTLLVTASFKRRQTTSGTKGDRELVAGPTDPKLKVKELRRVPVAAFAVVLAGSLLVPRLVDAQTSLKLPSVPATMATDVPQRMADGSLFVPKATQHLLSVRTVVTAETKAPRTVQLVGTVIADPNSFGRVQSGHAGWATCKVR